MHTTEVFSSYDEYCAWAETRPVEEWCEVVDGVPVLSPGCGRPHQRCQTRLTVLLDAVCPEGFEVLASPFDWVLWEAPLLGVREPDVLVCDKSDEPEDARAIYRPPLLAVEILSPGSGERDFVHKRREYAAARLDHYWIVDPQAPAISVYRRNEDTLELVASATGTDSISITEPLTLTFAPADLT